MTSPAEPDKGSCDNCLFSRPGENEYRVECHRYPQRADGNHPWITLVKTDWCGEHRRKT